MLVLILTRTRPWVRTQAKPTAGYGGGLDFRARLLQRQWNGLGGLDLDRSHTFGCKSP